MPLLPGRAASGGINGFRDVGGVRVSADKSSVQVVKQINRIARSTAGTRHQPLAARLAARILQTSPGLPVLQDHQFVRQKRLSNLAREAHHQSLNPRGKVLSPLARRESDRQLLRASRLDLAARRALFGTTRVSGLTKAGIMKIRFKARKRKGR